MRGYATMGDPHRFDLVNRDALIQVEAVSKVYDGAGVPVHALQDVDVEIHEGEFVAIMGPSGSGKSTLLHILGLLDADYEGRYLLNGCETSELDADELAPVRNREVGFVFQMFQLLPGLSILENAALPALYSRDCSEQECFERARHQLEQIGLAERLNHRPSQLSIGQRQRAAIARSLVNDPSLLLADEPTGALDSKTAQEILGIFSDLYEQGKTVVLVTHDHEVAKAARRLIHVRDGQTSDGRVW